MSISMGGEFTCAILDDDTLKCRGENGAGQLGLGNTTHRGDRIFQMGANLPAVSLY